MNIIIKATDISFLSLVPVILMRMDTVTRKMDLYTLEMFTGLSRNCRFEVSSSDS